MKTTRWAFAALIAASALSAQQAGKNLTWAYPVPDPAPQTAGDAGPKKLPGSSKAYTQAQIDDQFNPPDWYPEEHGALPTVVAKGIQVRHGASRISHSGGSAGQLHAAADGGFQERRAQRSESAR